MVALMKRSKREVGELTPAELVKQRKAELATARRQAADAEAALKRTQAKHEELVAAAERDEQAHVAELEEAREKLAVALADAGDVDDARATLDELEQAAKRRRDEAGVLANILERRRAERQETLKAARKAQGQFWRTVEQAELAQIPDLNSLRRAYVAAEKASSGLAASRIGGWIPYLEGVLGPMHQQQRAHLVDELEKRYG